MAMDVNLSSPPLSQRDIFDDWGITTESENLNNSKDSDEDVGSQRDIFEDSDEANLSVDIFLDSDEEKPVEPIGDIIPMEIDQPGTSNRDEVASGDKLFPKQQELTPKEKSAPEKRMTAIDSYSPQLGGPPPKIPHLDNPTLEEDRLKKALAQLREDSNNGIRHFGQYMQVKKDKLRYQVNVISRVDKVVSNIFRGVSIFVNGHTDPSALELRELIQTHGGEYHCYMEYGITTYTVASSLASAKIDKTRKDECFILPGWIIDCIAAGKLLPIDDYRLLPLEVEKNVPITNFFGRPGEAPLPKEKEKILDARDPNFMQEYYSRSRLHLISTLAQEMKDFVTTIRETGHFFAEEWDKCTVTKADYSITEPVVFHIDLDCFFVSVALRDRPELRDKTVAITHSRGSASAPGFSEVASVSYAARKLGMKNGMLVRDALKLCPTLICLPYQFEDYRTVSKAIYALICRFTHEVRAVSCDEMYVNFSKVCADRKIADIIGLANYIRSRIREETGCPASIGIGPNMLLARLSTKKAKPDGVYWTKKKDAVEFVADEKIGNIPGIGYMTVQKLQERFGEIEKCGDLQNIHLEDLEAIFGKMAGKHIYKHSRGEDDSLNDFMAATERKSVSCDINYGIRFTKKEEAVTFLGRVVEEVCKRLNQSRRIAGSVTLKLMVRSADAPVETPKYLGHGRCDTHTKTSLIKGNTDNPDRILKEVLGLYDQISPVIQDLRGVGVQCGRLVPVNAGVRRLQMSKNFFDPRSKPPPKEKKPEPSKKETKVEISDVMEMPKLNGLERMKDIKLEMKALFLEDPNEATIRNLTKFLYELLCYGAFSTLRLYVLYLTQMLSDPDTRDTWYEPLQAILHRVDTKTYWTYGGRWIQKEVHSNPLTNNSCQNICTCITPLNCSCRM